MTTLLRENQNRIDRVIDRVAYCAIDLEKAARDPSIDDFTRQRLDDLAQEMNRLGIIIATTLDAIGVARSPHPEHGTRST